MNDPTKMLWHNSALQMLNECEQKFTYGYIEGLKPAATGIPKRAMLVGSWFHALMAAQGLLQGRAMGTLIDPPEGEFNVGFDLLSGSVFVSDNLTTFNVIDPEDNGQYYVYELTPAGMHNLLCEQVWGQMFVDDETEDIPAFVWEMYQRYLAVWGGNILAEKVLGVEVEWSRTDPASGVTYGGRADRIVVTADGRVCLRDHKTTATAPDAQQRLSQPQLHLYAWGLSPWLAEHSGGMEFDEVEYDYVLNTEPPTVRLTKGTKNKPPSLYANQGLMDEAAFMSRLAGFECESEEQEAERDAILADAEHPIRVRMREEGNGAFFHRAATPVNETVVANLLASNESAVGRAIELSQGATPMRYLPAYGSDRHCNMCDFRDLCSGEMFGNDVSLLRMGFEQRTVEVMP